MQPASTICSYRDSQVSPSPKKNLSEVFRGNQFPELAFHWPTAGPKVRAWGEKGTFLLEKANRCGSPRGRDEVLLSDLGKNLAREPGHGQNAVGRHPLSLCVILELMETEAFFSLSFVMVENCVITVDSCTHVANYVMCTYTYTRPYMQHANM